MDNQIEETISYQLVIDFGITNYESVCWQVMHEDSFPENCREKYRRLCNLNNGLNKLPYGIVEVKTTRTLLE